jgi:hypothetical protein
MLTQLSTVKQRLAIDDLDVQYDALLTTAITAVSFRFDKETNRTLARTADATFEFSADDAEIFVPCYPIESLTKFETKISESAGWTEQTSVEYLVRSSCIVSLETRLIYQLSTINHQLPLARVTYTGGYLLPGSADVPSATRLPSDLEQAAIEQIAWWFLYRDRIGLTTRWPKGGVLERFAQLDLLLNVQTVLKRYQRWQI